MKTLRDEIKEILKDYSVDSDECLGRILQMVYSNGLTSAFEQELLKAACETLERKEYGSPCIVNAVAILKG